MANAEAIVTELLGRAHAAVVETVNALAEEVYTDSEAHVPKSADHDIGRYPETLAESGKVHLATPEDPVAVVEYDAPYAAAQEVGRMTYESKRGKAVEWEAHNYSTPSTGAHYLEDAMKKTVAGAGEELAVRARMMFSGNPVKVIK